ncbi:hypothetical protein GWI33_002812 [Rhynchophorus ferrugineus]|uniref:Uncharacterized protein n=1 Tax=Rhynchophorus ferrugineus TaxID=354439 RepID=A0A834MLG0_RHYFE|nr:hypothetical protein GWI33_002812 [Rhynchophorus ferrugineus]
MSKFASRITFQQTIQKCIVLRKQQSGGKRGWLGGGRGGKDETGPGDPQCQLNNKFKNTPLKSLKYVEADLNREAHLKSDRLKEERSTPVPSAGILHPTTLPPSTYLPGPRFSPCDVTATNRRCLDGNNLLNVEIFFHRTGSSFG